MINILKKPFVLLKNKVVFWFAKRAFRKLQKSTSEEALSIAEILEEIAKLLRKWSDREINAKQAKSYIEELIDKAKEWYNVIQKVRKSK